MTLNIREIGQGDTDAFERVLAIYREAIELSEQRPEEELRRLPGRSDYRIMAAERHGEIVGFSISHVPAAEDFWLFEYAATVTAERGRRTGAKLFLQAGISAGVERTALVEADAVPPAGGEVQEKRLRFYGRLGCRAIGGLDYILPLDANGTPPPMLLLALMPETVSHVSRDRVKRWLTRLYIGVYGKAPDDPRIALMLASLPENVPLAPLSPVRSTP